MVQVEFRRELAPSLPKRGSSLSELKAAKGMWKVLFPIMEAFVFQFVSFYRRQRDAGFSALMSCKLWTKCRYRLVSVSC